MREILFKAKRIDNGEWMEGSLIDSGNHYQVFIYPHDDSASTMSCKTLVYHGMVAVDSKTICQYTGLTDKNGQKIWENDILEWEFANAPSDYYECVWLEDECAFAFRHCKYTNNYENPVDCYDEDYTDGFYMKVIGNIFDNPELLKGGGAK